MNSFRVKVRRGNRVTLPQRICKLMGWRAGAFIDVTVRPDGSIALKSTGGYDNRTVILKPVRQAA